MGFKDLREFIDVLDKEGELVRIKEEVDWDLEAAAISRRVYELEGPAIFFEKVKDYPLGFRIFGGSLGTFRRVAIAMGLPPDISVREIYAEFERREASPIKPLIVETGPCKENKLLGNEVDLYTLPAPYIHDGDGGRYIGTWDVVVSKDPETGWQNWGMYRFMIHNKRFIVGFPRYHSHLGMVFHKHYIPRKEPMPIAVVLGASPLDHMVATTPYGIGVNEADYAGALGQEPVRLVKCETSDLLVPANAEIVIEGEILPDKVASEGPFGEYPGYRTEGIRMGVLCQVKAITYRTSPILTMISLGVPPDDSSIAASLTAGIAIKRRLKRHKIPITDVYVPPEGVTHLIVVGVKKGGMDIARKIGEILTARRADINKIIVVDDDVDVFNFKAVIHALATKCHPMRGIVMEEVESGKANPLTPCYTAEERRAQSGGLAIFDSTWPLEWKKETDIPVKSSFEVMYPQKIKEKVLEKWQQWGFKKEVR
jgi:4-hydroxy-3-polyprenylbenzoate decarboxylase